MRNEKCGGALIYSLFALRTNNGINKTERCCVVWGDGGKDDETRIKKNRNKKKGWSSLPK